MRPTLIFIALCASCAFAQGVFDVASVKEVQDFQAGTISENIVANPGTLSMRNVRLRACITWAYEVKDFQIAGPAWLGVPYWGGREISRYEILAKAPANTPVSEMRLMLRRLLADRFKLVLHRENKERPVFVLTFVNASPDFKASADQNAERRIVPGPDGLRFLNAPLADFADFLSVQNHSICAKTICVSGIASQFNQGHTETSDLSE